MWKKYGTAGQATYVTMAHAHSMLDNKGYRHTLRICNTYCFSSSTMVAWTRLLVALYVHCLACIKMPKVAFRSSAKSKSVLYLNTFLHKASSFRSLTHTHTHTHTHTQTHTHTHTHTQQKPLNGLHNLITCSTVWSPVTNMYTTCVACNETNLMHYLSSVYSVTTPLHVSGLLVAHQQEVAMYICDNWYVL
jgi:hypothetical protein